MLTYLEQAAENIAGQPGVYRLVKDLELDAGEEVRQFIELFVGSILLNLCALPLSAQTVTGALVGHVADSTESAMPGVKVVATEVNRGASREAVTNEAGNYTITSMDPGAYKVTIEQTGFKTFMAENVQVAARCAQRSSAECEERRLPGAAWTEDRDDLAVGDGERQPSQRLTIEIHDGQALIASAGFWLKASLFHGSPPPPERHACLTRLPDCHHRNASNLPIVKLPPVRIEYPPNPIMKMLLKNPTPRVKGKNRLRARMARTCC